MNPRVILIPFAVLILAGMLIYSQVRTPPNRVSGFIEADEIRLGSRIGGRVAKVLVDEGQSVEAGQSLVVLEPYDLLELERQAALTLAAREVDYQRLARGFRPEEIAQAKAHRDQLKAQLDLLKAGPRPQEIKAAEARLTAAKAETQLAEQLYERQQTLARNNAVSADELDRSQQAFESAAATLDVRENELQLMQLGTRDEDIRAAEAALEEAEQAWQLKANGYREEEIEQAKASRDAAKAALDAIGQQKAELTIHSPLSGTIDSLDLQPGDMVAAGAPVLSIMDHEHLWVRAYVPQNRVALSVGQKLRVTVDGAPETELTGTVSFIARQAEFTPNNVQTPEERGKLVFRIKVALEKAADSLRPGMSADVWLDSIGDAK